MTKILIAALGALALAASVPAIAQTPPASAPTATPAIPAAPGAGSVETTTIGDLLANPDDKAILETDYPQLIAYPGLDDIKGMTLRAISAYPEAQLDDAKLTQIQSDFNKVAKKP
jgi:hypothetical protein